jgi:transposase
MSNFRRSWSQVGKRVALPQQQAFINSYLYSAIAPVTGQSFHLMDLSDMDTQTEEIFLKELKKNHPNQHVVVVIDNAPCHRPQILHKVSGLSLIYLPSYSPELNPVERFFEELRRSTANKVFTTMEELENRLTDAVNSWVPEKLKQLCGYDWILKQLG